jgi:REP-associated tyrosine transposase
MPRIARMIVRGEKSVYHVMSRTALDGFPFGAAEKDEFVKIIQKFSKLYFVEVLGFCIMGNHFHLVVQMNTDTDYTDEDIQKRFIGFYGDDRFFIKENIVDFRKKWSSLSDYIKDIKHAFSWYYNKRHHRRGTLWGERFKSVIVQRGETLINCLAYIDLNPLRAGIVDQPEAYRWNSLGYHVQTGNKDKLLSMDFGLREFGVKTEKERLRRYRRYVYEAGAVNRPEQGKTKVIDKTVVEKERKKNFELSGIRRFQYRTRYFSDSGIIGTKEFVSTNYQLFKDLFQSKHEKIPKPIKGLDGVYSLKRLSEAV